MPLTGQKSGASQCLLLVLQLELRNYYFAALGMNYADLITR